MQYNSLSSSPSHFFSAASAHLSHTLIWSISGLYKLTDRGFRTAPISRSVYERSQKTTTMMATNTTNSYPQSSCIPKRKVSAPAKSLAPRFRTHKVSNSSKLSRALVHQLPMVEKSKDAWESLTKKAWDIRLSCHRKTEKGLDLLHLHLVQQLAKLRYLLLTRQLN